MGRMDGKVAIITGAARGMGAAFAKRLVGEGASVMLTDVLDAEGMATAAALGSRARYCHHDVREATAWTAVLAATEAAFGPVSVLVNNAGVMSFSSLEATDEAEFRRVIDINLTAVFLGMKAVAPSMRRAGGGSIVNISSVAGMIGVAQALAYTASKFAVRGMSKAAAIELAADRIRVNSVHPGVVETPMTEGITGELAAAAALMATIPLGRAGQPAELANLVLFLASDESSYSTGAEFVADGGSTAQ